MWPFRPKPKFRLGQRVRIVALNPFWVPRDGLETTVLGVKEYRRAEGWCYRIDTDGLPPLLFGGKGEYSYEAGLRPAEDKGDDTALTKEQLLERVAWDACVWRPAKESVT